MVRRGQGRSSGVERSFCRKSSFCLIPFFSRMAISTDDQDERTAYFASLVETYAKPPTAFPDALPRRKRVLEILPLAPPLPPRPPTQAEIERDLEEDEKARHMMLLSFSPLWPDVEKKYGRFAISAKVSSSRLDPYLG